MICNRQYVSGTENLLMMFPTSKESSSTRLVNIESSASPQAVSEFRDGYESGRSNENSTVDLKVSNF